MNLSFWHESLRRGQRGWCGLWKLSPLKGQTHFTPLPVPHRSFLRPHMGFTQAAEESEKCNGQGWNSPICALVLWWMMWCPAAIPRAAQRHSQALNLNPVWDSPSLGIGSVGMKECSYWGEKVWLILRLTCDKHIFETSWYLFACYFMVERPDKDLTIPFFSKSRHNLQIELSDWKELGNFNFPVPTKNNSFHFLWEISMIVVRWLELKIFS